MKGAGGMDSHSRLVGWLKVALPLTALALLSTLFLVARKIDPEAALPYAEVDVAERIREPRMTAPTYAGVTEDGATLTITAAEARPDTGNGASAAQVNGQLVTPDGKRTALSAGAMRSDGTAKQVLLQSGVQIATATGYEVKTDGLTVALDRTNASSTGPVEGFGPAGKLTADSFQMTQAATDPGQYLLVFNGHVRLIYVPGQTP